MTDLTAYLTSDVQLHGLSMTHWLTGFIDNHVPLGLLSCLNVMKEIVFSKKDTPLTFGILNCYTWFLSHSAQQTEKVLLYKGILLCSEKLLTALL